ncbi:hypothetical protein [Microbulbifer discodermiae]|uniref:hypothetical protein n=1 Tax=Microbulbifer sp. 2201CG32-9 TaxID=3232309 RepID=UPI00345C4A25
MRLPNKLLFLMLFISVSSSSFANVSSFETQNRLLVEIETAKIITPTANARFLNFRPAGISPPLFNALRFNASDGNFYYMFSIELNGAILYINSGGINQSLRLSPSGVDPSTINDLDTLREDPRTFEFLRSGYNNVLLNTSVNGYISNSSDRAVLVPSPALAARITLD